MPQRFAVVTDVVEHAVLVWLRRIALEVLASVTLLEIAMVAFVAPTSVVIPQVVEFVR